MLALFSIRGRAGRREFWLCAFAPIASLIGLILFVSQVLGQNQVAVPGYPSLVGSVAMFVIVLLALTASVRRLHDRGKSALWLVPYLYGPIWLGSTAESTDATTTMVAGWISIALMVWGIIDLAILPGTPGPNHYGPARNPPAAPRRLP